MKEKWEQKKKTGRKDGSWLVEKDEVKGRKEREMRMSKINTIIL